MIVGEGTNEMLRNVIVKQAIGRQGLAWPNRAETVAMGSTYEPLRMYGGVSDNAQLAWSSVGAAATDRCRDLLGRRGEI